MLEWKDSLRNEYINGRENLRKSLVDVQGKLLLFALSTNIDDLDIYSDLSAINHKLDLITDGFSEMSGEKIYFYIIHSNSPLTSYCHKQGEAYVIILDVDTAIYLREKIRKFYGERQSVKLPGGLSIKVDQIIYSAYLYIYFHEMAHVMRGHLDYPQEDFEPRLGTEYDADIIGASLAYKNLGVIVDLPNIDAKVLTLLGIYWTFRTLDVHDKSMSKASEDYPSALARILLAFNHLNLIDYNEEDLEVLITSLVENENIVSTSGTIFKREKRLINYMKSSQSKSDLAKISKAREDDLLKFMPYRMTRLEV